MTAHSIIGTVLWSVVLCANDKMNLSLQDVGGNILLVSQFTLHASTEKGNRPSFIKAARPEIAIPLYEQTIKEFETVLGKKINGFPQISEISADLKFMLISKILGKQDG